MNIWFVLFWMVFMHVVDDYYLQGVLAKMKQKSWWEENAPNKLYKNDYIVALIMHAISWSFCVMLPLAVYVKFDISAIFGVMFVINVVIHAIVDNLKANKKTINLWEDQTCHILQVCSTWILVLTWS